MSALSLGRHKSTVVKVAPELNGRITNSELMMDGLANDCLIVKLDPFNPSIRAELLDLYIKAFANYPFISILYTSPEVLKSFMKFLLDFNLSNRSVLLYGIRVDNRLICASISVDSKCKYPLSVLIRSIFPIAYVLLKHVRELWIIRREMLKEIPSRDRMHLMTSYRPKYVKRYLELAILGTLPEYQRQGYGRKMLHFLYNEAKQREYSGIILITARDTPAFHFYLKEGFIVDKEIQLEHATLCWMRLSLK